MFRYFLDHLQANIFQEKVQSLRAIHYGIPYCSQGVRKKDYKNNYKSLFKLKMLLKMM